MKNFSNNSDKLFKWSDYGTSHQLLPSPKTQTATSTSSRYWHPSASRLTHRNLQTLWQTHLQMSERQGARPKILSINQLSWPETKDDLCFQRKKRSSTDLFKQPSEYEIDHGTDQRDQPRTACATGVVLGVFSNRHYVQYQRCRCYCCQYGVRLLSCKVQRRGHSS